jgi:GAF domain-containing protein
MADGKPPEFTQRLRDYQQLLGSFTRLASEAIPFERLLHHAVAQVARVTHIKRSKVMEYRTECGDLLVVAGVGWNEGVVGRATLGINHRSPPGRSVQTAGPVAIGDLPGNSEFDYSSLLKDHQIVSLLNVPIMIDGRTWGVLEVDTENRTNFDEVDIEFLGILANVIGTAAARYEAEQRCMAEESAAARQRSHAEIALRELQHRTKNNLQIIVGFLSIKRRQARSEEAREMLGAIIGRIEAVALSHDLLSVGQDSSSAVDFSTYLEKLCLALHPNARDIKIVVNAERAELPLNRAVPAALVVNELVTNALKIEVSAMPARA